MSNLLNVSPSPHTHGKESTQKLMLNVVLALIPALITSVFYLASDIIVTVTSMLHASCSNS
jgi:electron transport complex protein RnfD